MGRVRWDSGATVVRAIDRGKAKRGGSSLPWLILAAAHGCGPHTSGLEFRSCIIIRRPTEPTLNTQDTNGKKFKKYDDLYSNPEAKSI